MKIVDLFEEEGEVTEDELSKSEITVWFKEQLGLDVTLSDEAYENFLGRYDPDSEKDEFEEFLNDFADDWYLA